MTHGILLEMFADSGRFIDKALEGVPDDRLADQPGGFRNHPAWTIAHVCVANDLLLHLLGRDTLCPPAWSELARPGTTPKADRSAYPRREELVDMLKRQHDAIDRAVRVAEPADFEQTPPDAFRSFAPTVGHIVAYLLTAHENYHLAQLQAWKRVAGLGGD